MTWQAEAIISIHVPLAGNVRLTALPSRMGLADFYPRSPCGERRTWTRHPYPRWHFYPRSPCGERQGYLRGWNPHCRISIHVPLAGNVLNRYVLTVGIDISIHVPLAGNVLSCRSTVPISSAFLSTFPLRGTSAITFGDLSTSVQFLSTFPLRGTSRVVPGRGRGGRISIHVPLAGNVRRTAYICPT